MRRDVLQIVRGRVLHGEPVAGQRPRSLVRRGSRDDVDMPGEILAGHRVRIRHDLGGRARGHDVAAVLARAGAEVEHVVGLANRVFIVLDDENRVAQVAQIFERRDQPLVVALMQANATARRAHTARRASREPICVASRMRWPSPPESVAAVRSSER